MAELRESELDDLAGAIECYSDILELDPSHQGARRALERRISDDELLPDIAKVLEPGYRQLGEWEPLINLIEMRLRQDADPSSQIDRLIEIGGLWVEKFGDGVRAFEAYSRCFKLAPENALATRELERLAAIEDRWRDLATLYEDGAAACDDSNVRHDLLLRLGQICEERLDDGARAAEFYRQAQDIEPNHEATLDALDKLYAKLERWPDMLDVYRRQGRTDGRYAGENSAPQADGVRPRRDARRHERGSRMLYRDSLA